LAKQTEGRKADHLQICLDETVQARRVTSGFEDVSFVHRALPETDKDKIELSTSIFNHKLKAPLIVGAMTGGTEKAKKINALLAETVETLGLGMGVGSQRVAIEDPRLEETFSIARKKAPTAFLVANIGGPQLVKGHGVKESRKAVDMINADALAIHLNPLQEAIQPEGEPNYKGVLAKIGEITHELDVPVIVKETGAGMAAEEAKMLESVGVAGIDVAGAGGTSWAAVEYYRSKMSENIVNAKLGKTFWDWGIPTVVSIVEVSKSTNIPIIASGGIRTGIDVVKSISLGAEVAGLAQPLLKPALNGEIKITLQTLIKEFKTAMFLIGVNSIKTLKSTPLIITGRTAEWLKARGFTPEEYARRGID